MVALLSFIQDKAGNTTELPKKDIWDTLQEVLNMGLHVGEGDESVHLTLGLMLLLILVLLTTSFLLNWLRILVTRKMHGKDKLKSISIFRFIKFLIYVPVVLITLSVAGIDITVLITASAVLFVGLGLALQDLFQDFIGGIFILIDKSLKVGDIVEIDNKVVRVFEVKLRTTRAITRDDKVVIIPNHKFISDLVYNHTQNQDSTRESVNVGVAYGSDIDKVTQILLDCARNHQGILKKPEPFVLFQDFGNSALLFSLIFHLRDSFTSPILKSEIRYEIVKAFRENQITIPFPQRDVHIYQHSPFQVKQQMRKDGNAQD